MSFTFDNTVYVAETNPASDAIPWLDLDEYTRLGGTAFASRNQPTSTCLPCDAEVED